MNGYAIESAMRSDAHVKTQYIGTFAADTLPRHVHALPALLIVNNQKNTQEGEHWLAIAIDNKRHGIFFDTYGRAPFVRSHRNFLNRNCTRWTYNTKCLQSIGTDVCGQYCITFLMHQAHGVRLKDFLKTYFTDDTLANDITVSELFDHYTKCTKLCEDFASSVSNQKACARKQ